MEYGGAYCSFQLLASHFEIILKKPEMARLKKKISSLFIFPYFTWSTYI